MAERSFGQELLHNKEKIFDDVFEGGHLWPQVRYFAGMGLLFSSLYGFVLGFYSHNLQIAMAAVKVPLLLFGTIAVCLPTLYTSNVLLGSRLSFRQTLAILMVANYLLCLVLVSFAPIMLLFILSTTNKPFIVLLNVTMFAVSGGFGVALLWRAMRHLSLKSGDAGNAMIIRIWSLTYMFVGTQMAWILRPFIGEKGLFILYRKIEGNFYLAVIYAIGDLFK